MTVSARHPGQQIIRNSDISHTERYDKITADLDPPLAIVDLDAFDANAEDLSRRANGLPIRVASKSLRCRALIERALSKPGYQGVMCYSLAEARWLFNAGTSDDLLVAYPTADRDELRGLAKNEAERQHITLTVDCLEHLDFIDRELGDGHPEIRLCLELDVAWEPLPGLHIGAWRSPLHSPEQAETFAKAIIARPGFRLVGILGYEGQIAGVGDAPPRHPVKGWLVRAAQARSANEIRKRRAEAVNRIRALTPIEFVNGGGTGSLELTAAEGSVTELAAGSGLVGGLLFDAYRRFRPRPALMYALPVVRRPAAKMATLFSGGYIASGTGTKDRLPRPVLAGLRLTGTEGAGEVQTPVRGLPAAGLGIGDRVWMRHAKAGELAERVRVYQLINGDDQRVSVPTYRGEERCFG